MRHLRGIAMKNRSLGVALTALSASALVAYAAGCDTTYQDYVAPLMDPKLATWNDGGPGGHDGGNKPDCSGDPSDKNTIDECGVFAQADAAPGGNGSKAAPFSTLTDAITAAESTGRRVYACASKPFSEAVTISAGIEVFGGFDCAKGWAWSQDARTALNGPADTIALVVQKSAAGAKVEGFAITAASPSDMKGGGSSIAVAVDDVTATLKRCDVVAGDAADGVIGMTPSGFAMKGTDAATVGASGAPSDACVVQAGVMGGSSGSTTCDDGVTAGGNGGTGGITGTNSGDGADGGAGSPADPANGLGGAGESAAKCVNGTPGKDGDPGAAGPGGSPMGDHLALGGITNADMTDAQPGTKAQGGGGGGGAKSGVFCKVGANTVDGPGASGGGGGAGGCGGRGGGGGKAGGSSIAIVSLGTKLVLSEVTLTAGKAGKGGDGALGQGGGDPGLGAVGGAKSGLAGSTPGCKGGDGGLGGDGGPGGGGRGGHAIGLAYAKAPATTPVLKTFTPGTPGNGGAPGAAGGNSGANGSTGPCWDFGTHAACK
jgi:hypothetical protein